MRGGLRKRAEKSAERRVKCTSSAGIQLPIANEFEGVDHGGLGVSFLLVDAAPGDGPALHMHANAEVFRVLEGGIDVRRR